MSFGKRICTTSSRGSRLTLDSDATSQGDECEDGKSNHKRVNRNLSEKKRRDQFNMLVHELCSMVSATNSKKMDKSTVLKSTISYLRNYQETAVQAKTHEIKENWKPSFLSNDEFMHLMLEAQDSCLLVFNQQGNIVYASESITSLLGHLPTDLVNQQVYDFIEDKERSQLYNLICHVSMTPENLSKSQLYNLICHVSITPEYLSKSQLYNLICHVLMTPENLSKSQLYNLICHVSMTPEKLSKSQLYNLICHINMTPENLSKSQLYNLICHVFMTPENLSKLQLYNLICHVSMTPENLSKSQLKYNLICRFSMTPENLSKSLYNLICHVSMTPENFSKSQLYNLICHVSMPPENLNDNQVSFSCHFKRGSLGPDKPPVYETVKFTGFKHWNNFNDDDDWNYGMMAQVKDDMSFCCTVQIENAQFIREMSIIDEAKAEFTSRHSLEWKFLYLDHRASPIIGYLPFEVLGTSGYDYYHPDDLENLSKCHEQLMQKGEETSRYYRFLTKGQQWIWLRTRYYITYHQWNSKPEFVVCTNVVVNYSDVRENLWKDMGYNTANGHTANKRERSPSVCSVTSGPNMSSCHSVGSASSDRAGSSKLGDNDNSPSSSVPTSKYIPQTVSQHLQLLLQHRLLHQPLSQSQPPTGLVTMESQQGPTPSTSTTQMTPVVEPTSPQLFLTPVQQQLYRQLQDKAQQLQSAIVRQQTELQQITQQLSFAKQGGLTVPVMSSCQPIVASVSVSPIMFATTCGMLPTSPLPPSVSVQPILPLQPVMMDHTIPFHQFISKDNSDDPSLS
ncbi:CLOCK [Mytilus edulis]|uniref:CLOCK n=1 Tax=Mytilus edulis TaxID=6550 RepID=A0A8S3UYE3_MYTED|nr:CLOCK [Mytilus edulis]